MFVFSDKWAKYLLLTLYIQSINALLTVVYIWINPANNPFVI